MLTLLIIYIAGGALLAGLSIPLVLGRIPPNGLYGFRVPATIENPALWYPVNRYAGWRLLFSGLLIILAAVGLSFVPGLSLDGYALLCLAVFTLALGVTIVQSFIHLAHLKRSLPPGEATSGAAQPKQD